MKCLTIIIFLVSFIFRSNGFAQEKLIKNIKITTFAGFRDDQRDSFPNDNNLDFINYFSQDKEYLDYEYLGLSTHITFRNNIETILKFVFFGGLRNIHLTAQYFPHKNFGLNCGIYSCGFMMNEFSTYHKLTDKDMFGDLETNYRQRFPVNAGLLCGITYRANIQKLQTIIKLNTGFSSIIPFSENVSQKQIDGNYQKQIKYKTQYNFEFFIFPEIEINIDCINLKKTVLGMQFQSNLFFSKKSINYKRTTYEWTAQNSSAQSVIVAKHKILLIEFDFGIYIKL